MFEYTPTKTDILNIENTLDEFELESTDISNKIEEAKKVLIADLKNHGKQIKRIGVPFGLTSSKSDEDKVERLRYKITITNYSVTGKVTIQGTNDESNETWNTVKEVDVSADGDLTGLIDNPYLYYKVSETGTFDSETILVEDVHELPWKYKAIALIFASYSALVDDHWRQKADDYNQMYHEAFQRTLYSYDYDLDGEVENCEMQINRVGFHR